ncbi:MAG: hypothetical protein R3E68_05875 [Burkholderiaceae bacterium]
MLMRTESLTIAGSNRFVPTLGALLRRLGDTLMAWVEWIDLMDQVHRERADLARLGPGALRDLGINQASADFESRRGYFDIPQARRPNPSRRQQSISIRS